MALQGLVSDNLYVLRLVNMKKCQNSVMVEQRVSLFYTYLICLFVSCYSVFYTFASIEPYIKINRDYGERKDFWKTSF